MRRGWWAVPALLVVAIVLVLANLWWANFPQSPATEATAAGQLLSRIRIAPDAALPLNERLALEKDLLQADATARNAAAAARSAAIGQGLGVLVQLLTTIAAGTAGYIAWRNLRETQKKLDVDREGQVTNRFTQAITQLGAELKDGKPNLEVRLGGIYALERIARDSPRDHWTIVEVLTAYVRQNAPWPPTPQIRSKRPGSRSAQGRAEQVSVSKAPRFVDGVPYFHLTGPEPPRRPRADVQAILTVLGRRDASGESTKRRMLDLRNTDLRGASLSALRFENADLMGAHLEHADLEAAHLMGISLQGAHLQQAYLSGAHLQQANLGDAQFQQALLWGTEMQEALLMRAQLQKANLQDAGLQRAWLTGAQLQGALLIRTHLDEADLTDAHLTGGNFKEALGLSPEQVLNAYEHGRGALLPKAWSDAQRETVWARWPEGVAFWKQRWQEDGEHRHELAAVPDTVETAIQQPIPTPPATPHEANGAGAPPRERGQPETPAVGL